MLLPILFILLFIVASVPLVAAPLRRGMRPTGAVPFAGEAGSSPSRYETTLLALRDLEFDHQLGVVAGDDYARLRTQLMSEAASALETAQRQQDESVSARIEAAVRARRRQSKQRRATVAHFCPRCGNRVDDGDRFCTGCGASLT